MKNAFFYPVSWPINALSRFYLSQTPRDPHIRRSEPSRNPPQTPGAMTKAAAKPKTKPKPVPSKPVKAAAPAIRVLLAKVGLDGHDRGVKIVARCLRDAGMDVIYTGLHRTPEEVVSAAVQEDVDVLGVSLLSGAHMTIIPRILKLLKDSGAGDIQVLAGGVMPDEDVARLKKIGVREVLLQDTPPDAIVAAVRRLVVRGRR